MKCFRLLFFVVLLLQSLFSSANTPDNPPNCPLPAPAWIKATFVSSSTIEIKWADVNGATFYKIERFDVTHGVQLPDAYATEPEFASEPHDPGTTISFEISATSCGESGEYGESITGEYTTSVIIVDDIVFFTIPNPTQGNMPIMPGSDSPAFGFSDANKTESDVDVLRLKVSYSDIKGVHSAEVLFWSHCSNFETGGPRVMYWNVSGWQGNISYVENHYNENPFLPVMSITFRSYGQPFFTIYNPTLGGEELNLFGGLTIHNDCAQLIYFGRSVNTEHNPCYVPPPPPPPPPPSMIKKGAYEANSDDSDTEDRDALALDASNTDLNIHPNPFSDGFMADYVLEQESPVRFSLFDYTGRVVQQVTLPGLPAGKYSTGISMNNLPNGIYLLALETNQGRTISTVVKQN